MPTPPPPWNDLLAHGSTLTAPRTLVADVPRRPEPKPLWSVDGIGALLDGLVAARVAVGRGHVFVERDGVLEALAPADGAPGRLLGPDGFFWECARAAGESWPDFAARSVGEARAVLQRAEYTHTGAGELFADLACITADEPALYELPRYVRDGWDRVAESGDFGACSLPMWEQFRVRHASPAPGSVFGAPATRVAAIPADARFARVDGRARDIRRLAELRELRVLDILDVRDDALAAAAALPHLRALVLRDVRTPTLDALEGCTAAALYCAEASRLRDAGVVARLPGLEALWIDVSGVRDLEFLRPATKLRALLFTGGLTSLASLEPLSDLTGLQHLYVGHVRIRDKSLRPLHGLAGLRTLKFPDRFAAEEIAALAGALPYTAGIPDSAVTTTGVSRFDLCRRCSSADVVLTVGSPVRKLCRACDDAKIRKHALRWELALASAARGPSTRRPPLRASAATHQVRLVRLRGS